MELLEAINYIGNHPFVQMFRDLLFIAFCIIHIKLARKYAKAMKETAELKMLLRELVDAWEERKSQQKISRYGEYGDVSGNDFRRW